MAIALCMGDVSLWKLGTFSERGHLLHPGQGDMSPLLRSHEDGGGSPFHLSG